MVAVASGVLCGMLDVLWVGEFDLERGREIASDKVESFVKKSAKLTGCESDDLGAAVKHLEKLFPIPSDGNTPDFGGGLQHHLRDFAHHPTIVGLMFSLLTQFTYKSYGTNTAGAFIIVDVPEKSRPFIGEDVQNIMEIEKGLVELRLQLDVANGKDKKLLKAKIKEAEESVEAMKIARKSMLKFQSSFETGLAVE